MLWVALEDFNAAGIGPIKAGTGLDDNLQPVAGWIAGGLVAVPFVVGMQPVVDAATNERASRGRDAQAQLLGLMLRSALGSNVVGHTPAAGPATTVKAQLDTATASGSAGVAAAAAAQADATQALADAAAALLYTPAGGIFTNPQPTLVTEALDRIGAAVAGLLAGTIP